MRLAVFALICATALRPGFAEGDWVEAATPGKAPDVAFGDQKEGIRSVLDLTAFDGRLYISLSPGEVAEKILCFDPGKEQLVEEFETQCVQLGTFRVIGKELVVPEAVLPKEAEEGGYYVSKGQGKWERVGVARGKVGLWDVARFDGKTFLAGSLNGQAIVAWRPDGEEKWQIVPLTAQAARWSPCAERFLATPDHLSLLAVRRPDPNPMSRAAPQDWGAWYVLHYCPKLSERGLLFDGEPRPLPALRLMAPGSELPNVGRMLAHDTTFAGGLLYTVLAEGGTIRDEKAGLFHATVKGGGPQVGRTLVARRLADMDLARDVAVENGTCYVLLAANAPERKARIVASPDLEKWQTVFSGEFDASPVSLGVLKGTCFVGLADGALLTILKDK